MKGVMATGRCQLENSASVQVELKSRGPLSTFKRVTSFSRGLGVDPQPTILMFVFIMILQVTLQFLSM